MRFKSIMFHMIRPGRFKHRLLTSEFLQSASMTEAIEHIQKAEQLWQSKKIDDVEWVALYVFILSTFRRPSDFLGGPHNEKFSADIKGKLTCQDILGLFKDPPRILTKLKNEQNFLNLFCSRSLRSVPLSVQKSIALWSQHDCLKLCEYIPSPEEVLAMQSLGIRCVSVLTDPVCMRGFVEEGRDVLGFVVHDLIHADHFFSDPQQAKAQIQFSKYLQKLHALPLIQQKLRQDIEFMSEWNYLISDMNSVPLHLFKTLKAILLAASKREHKIDFKNALKGDSEASFNSELEDVANEFSFSQLQKTTWLRLNGPDFTMPTDAMILIESLEH